MKIERFDDLSRSLATGASRRSLVRALGAAALGIGGIVGTNRGVEAGVLGDPEVPDNCRRGCLRACRRERQRCVLRTGNPFRCNRNCEDRCCDKNED